ncbi:IclR family transcriptional regulator [Caldinitratiruptor microaerophilus]|uniref:Glycerol operon regulatory protein n=1 Tax=Caldinitratiruptor microaerophilus TaxID=671077 RepID=A0AA35CKG7_9FIRM|nr:IclR family transcriptional regulator [Caldinitratiruptor microaerophilus]BDG59172.1 IclR family transcriptional regulator [Caldinitratiruptor microaerophilus]
MAVDRQLTIQAVDRALAVLLLFAEPPVASGDGRGLGVTQIAERLNLAKSTAHRILSTLEARGFLRQDPATGRYHLGLKALELAGAYLAQSDLPTVAYPEMVHLRDEVEETVSLYVRDRGDRVRVQKAEGRHGVRRVVGLGQRLPLHLGASGKVLLAFTPEPERSRLLEALERQHGIDIIAFRQMLDKVREQGYAVSAEEREQGVASVAAPIFDRSGQLVAALAVSGPVQRFDEAAIVRYSQAVREAAHRIGVLL